jgi:hypothetical protein
MMLKRILLMAGTFAVLLAAFLLYYYASQGPREQDYHYDQPEGDAGEGLTDVGAGMRVGPVGRVEFRQYDEQHRLQAIYLASRAERRGPRFELSDPRIEWYLGNGQMVTVRAEHASVRANQVGQSWNPREGRLLGEVVIEIDRRPDPLGKPLAERPEDAVRIYTDNLYFDRDSLTIETDSRVSVFSSDVDILGRGLRLAWNESPEELRQLIIEEGEYLCLREGQDRFMRDISLPGGEAAMAEPRPVELASAAGAGGGPGAAALPAAVASADAEAALLAQVTGPDEPNVPAEPVAPGGPPPVVKDTYEAVFNEGVAVTSGSRSLRGARQLRLVFEFRPSDQALTGRPDPETAPAPPAAGGPASAPADDSPAPPPAPPTPAEPGRAEAPAPATAPATRPVEPEDREPLYVTWSGPLVIQPIRRPERHVPGRMEVAARGDRMVLADAEIRAVCDGFSYDARAQTGRLVGGAEPVRLAVASGERMSAPVVRLDRRAGQVHFDGAGSMRMRASQEGVAALGQQPEQAAGDRMLTVEWERSVVARFGRQEYLSPGPDGPDGREFLHNATFSGEVDCRFGDRQSLRADRVLVEFRPPRSAQDEANRLSSLSAAGRVHLRDGQSGDFIKTESLVVSLAEEPDGRVYPTRADAAGDVRARQETTGIESEKLTVLFALEDDPAGGDRRLVRPWRLEAAGAVHVADRTEDGRIVARADTLSSNLQRRTARLRGKGSRLTQFSPEGKENVLAGEDILLRQDGESAVVTGPGSLRFWTDSDLSGNRTDRPRPVDLTWKRQLEYSGRQRRAVVRGDVRMATAEDELSCGALRVLFEKDRPDEPGPASRPAGEAAVAATAPAASTRPSADDALRTRGIAMVMADEEVKMASVRRDADGLLLRRLLLRGEQVVYEAQARRLNCIGAGTMVVEDYRPPKKGDDRDGPAAEVPSTVDRPSQSAFRWAKSMDLDQARRLVRMSGKVRMAHRSGAKVALKEKLNVPEWSELPPGRHTVLSCERMLAQFAAPDDGPASATASAEAGAAGPRVGRLELFDARRDVNLKDGPRQVVCQRLLYERSKDIAIIHGHLAGKPPRNAVVYLQGEQGRTLNTWKSSKLIWHRKTDRIETAGVEAGGGR